MAMQVMSNAATKDSVWAATEEMPTFNPLKANAHADVCIVGAGIAGLTTAHLLLEAGRSVIVLDDGGVASGMTAVTSAHLANALDDRYFEIERLHGEAGARLAAESHTAAIARIEAIVNREKIACDFSRLDGYLFLGAGQDEQILDRELAATHRAGLTDVAKVAALPLASLSAGPCLRFPNQGQFHPLKYLAGVAHAVRRAGGQIFAHTHADHIEGGRPAHVQAGAYCVTAAAVVVATNTPINDLVAIHTKQAPYMTYVIGAKVPRGTVPSALYWDTEDPYHYVRLQRMHGRGAGINSQTGYDLLIVGGEDHKTGQADDTDERHARLESWGGGRAPLGEGVEGPWAGQVMETIDGLAFIGRNPLDKDNVFIVTGDSGMGLTHGTIAGMLLTDLIQGRENRWAKLYEPSRKTLGAAGAFAKEALNTATQYADWVTPGDVKSVDEIARDSGALLRHGLSKVAIYRDANGKLHQFSAVCPHLGCIVQWSAAEKTWDCPCHGSRFDKLGKVINGPANSNLTQVESP
jgi:glycine/D-amino acid oxidase-like deaminating enzyme/nitrite reductase/ring-hydroxylating ferredoxin subunit